MALLGFWATLAIPYHVLLKFILLTDYLGALRSTKTTPLRLRPEAVSDLQFSSPTVGKRQNKNIFFYYAE